MNMFENYYGKPQGNVNLYGFNLPLEYYNCLWKEDDKMHIQPLIMLCKGQEVIPRANATDLVDKIYKLCNVINRSVGDLNQKNSHIEFLEKQLQKYISNEDKKNELSLANNDIMKNNQEMEKIHENREDRLFDRNNDQTKYWMDKYQSKEDEYDKKLKSKEEEWNKKLKSKEEEYDKKLKDKEEEYDKKLKSKEKEVKANAEKLKYLINILIDNKVEINKDIINNSIDKIFNLKEDDDNE